MSEATTGRRPRFRRIPDPPRMILTERDHWIILRVYEHRFLSRDQIAQIFFPAREGAQNPVLLSSCNARLQRLYQHGYLYRQMLGEGSGQAIYSLDRRGAELLNALLGPDLPRLRWSPKQRRAERYFMEHTLAINDVWVAFRNSGRQAPPPGDGSTTVVTNWTMDSPQLWDKVDDPQAPKGYLPVRPDSFFGLDHADRRAYFFLEVDRATMSSRRFAEKIRAYQRYWKSGSATERYGAPSFRVLVTAPSARRRDNLRRAAEKLGARGMFLFAVHSEVRSDRVLEPIWLRPHTDQPVSVIQ